MDNQIQILNNLYDDAVAEDVDFKYKIPFEKSQDYEVFNESTRPLLLDFENEIEAVDFKEIYGLFEFHFEYSLFADIKLKDSYLAKKHLSLANTYGVFTIHYGVLSSPYISGQQPFVPMNKATLILSSCILANQEQNVRRVGNYLLDSLNKRSAIMKRGQSNAHIGWFIIQLYAKRYEKSLNVNKVFMPKGFELFQEVLDNWDTQDQQLVEKFIFLLADNHIAQSSISSDINLRNLENETFNFSELFLPGLYLLPYEILVWLKFRQEKSLENPIEFSHPLMNTSIVNTYLAFTNELPVQADFSFISSMTEKIKKHYNL